MKLNKSFFLALSLLLFFACKTDTPEPAKKSQGRTITPESTLTFLSESGEEKTTINIAIADEPAERNQGLMDVRTLPSDAGMLFIFENESIKSFYMRNTPLPLDIMYVNKDSVIVRIYQNTTPFSETSLPSEAPALYVVETNGGFSLNHGITEGMRIKF